MTTLKASTPLRPNSTSPNTRLLFVVVRSAMPVPLSVTFRGLVAVLLSIASDAPCAPTLLGVNATPSVQFVLGATVTGIAPQVPPPVREYSESDGVALEMTSEWVLPVL